MPYDLLLLPLLGGFLLVRFSHITAYYIARQSGQRLLFSSAIAGIFLIFISRIIVLAFIAYLPSFAAFWKGLAPFPYLGTAVGAFILGAVLWKIINYFIPKDRALDLIIEKFESNGMELFFHSIVKNYDEGLVEQVELNLVDNKVYIGLIRRTPPHFGGADSYIEILPFISGYRDATTKELIPTTFYDEVYSQITDKNEDDKLDHFYKIIPMERIGTASKFDPDYFSRFSENSES